jgi:hypothetical protein
MRESKFPQEDIKVMLHALGISHHKNGEYIQPNKRYSPYPTTYRNYYQIDKCEIWEELKNKGFANDSISSLNLHFYYVTDEGKKHLKSLGYKWHEKRKKSE